MQRHGGKDAIDGRPPLGTQGEWKEGWQELSKEQSKTEKKQVQHKENNEMKMRAGRSKKCMMKL